MGRKPTDREQEEFVKFLRSGRDEMNLLEHSISSASKEVDRNTRSLLFTRDDKDPETGEPVERIWEASFSGKYGRPTPKDDDVFVACMKLSAAGNFASPRVEFTRYELCQILGWPDDGRSYKAIDDAFNRLAGVLIVATNYWYDNQARIWVDRKFGVIDDVFLYQREKYQRAKKAAGGKNPKSWFRWSDVMQESFAAGYVRKLDLEVYLSLENPIARKLYRYLGKHFWNRSKHAIDLQVLCHEKLGYNQSEKRNPRLKEKIEPAIKELEAKGIYGLSHEFKASYGKCEVVFNAKSKSNDKPKKSSTANPLAERLVKLGVDRGDASDAVQRLPSERIIEDIEHVEFEAKSGRVKSSKAGMLATMLKASEPWPRPQGFVSSTERERKKQAAAEGDARKRKLEAEREAREREAEERKLQAFHEFMAALTDVERAEFDERARRVFFYGEHYRKAIKAGDAEKLARCRHSAFYAAWLDEQKNPQLQTSSEAREVQKSIRF